MCTIIWTDLAGQVHQSETTSDQDYNSLVRDLVRYGATIQETLDEVFDDALQCDYDDYAISADELTFDELCYEEC